MIDPWEDCGSKLLMGIPQRVGSFDLESSLP